jgi:hypothetical protein
LTVLIVEEDDEFVIEVSRYLNAGYFVIKSCINDDNDDESFIFEDIIVFNSF